MNSNMLAIKRNDDTIGDIYFEHTTFVHLTNRLSVFYYYKCTGTLILPSIGRLHLTLWSLLYNKL